VGDLSPEHRRGKHSGLELAQYQMGEKPADIVISFFVNGKSKQYAGWTPLFRESRELASIVHFGAPMIVQPLRGGTVSRSGANAELHLRFGTPGLERSTFASLAYEAVPDNVHPRAEIDWPRAQPDSAPVRTTVVLSERY
jgi:hypothetical protein